MQNVKSKAEKLRREVEELKKMKGVERIEQQEVHEKEMGRLMQEVRSV